MLTIDDLPCACVKLHNEHFCAKFESIRYCQPYQQQSIQALDFEQEAYTMQLVEILTNN